MTLIVKNKGNQTLPYSEERMTNYINKIVAENNVSLDEVEVKDFIETIHNYVNSFDSLTIEEVNNKLIIEAQSRIDVGKTDWDIIAERVLLKSLYKTASKNRFYSSDDKYGSFLGLINTLVAQGIYSESLINKYSSNEITELGAEIDAERDKLFTYTGLDLLSSRYLVKTSEGTMELPQERWMIIAMYLMQDETKDRKEKILDSYWALSNLLMTVATPTMANAGHARGQLSSCFPKGTKISTDTGIKPIEEVKEGELAITHDGSRQTVTALNVREDEGGLYTLKNAFDEAEILATAEHPFLVKTSLDEDRVMKDLEGDGTTTNFHWVAMKDIKEEDFVVKGNTSTTDGNDDWIALDGYFGVRVTEITLAEGTNTVYNLEVDTHHTYIAEGYIVHNCFITSPEDSLDGIYKNEFNIARLSKWGGGIGTYLGFLRSRGASIRGVAGASSGIVPWAKGLNNVAVSVDQLG